MGDRRRKAYVLTTERSRVDIDRVHLWLSQESYWATDRERDVVVASVEGSLPYCVFADDVAELGAPAMVAFARVVTDGATFAWICDVFVDATHRGRGLGSWLVDSIVEDLAARDIKRFVLATKDAHEVYRHCGFAPLARADWWMEMDRRTARAVLE